MLEFFFGNTKLGYNKIKLGRNLLSKNFSALRLPHRNTAFTINSYEVTLKIYWTTRSDILFIIRENHTQILLPGTSSQLVMVPQVSLIFEGFVTVPAAVPCNIVMYSAHMIQYFIFIKAPYATQFTWISRSRTAVRVIFVTPERFPRLTRNSTFVANTAFIHSSFFRSLCYTFILFCDRSYNHYFLK